MRSVIGVLCRFFRPSVCTLPLHNQCTATASHTTCIAIHFLLCCLLTLLLAACPVCWIPCSLDFCRLLLLSRLLAAHASPGCQYCFQKTPLSHPLSLTLLLLLCLLLPRLSRSNPLLSHHLRHRNLFCDPNNRPRPAPPPKKRRQNKANHPHEGGVLKKPSSPHTPNHSQFAH